MSDKPTKAREICSECGGVMMGPLYWVDEAPTDAKICRKGRVVCSGEDLDGDYTCHGTRFQRVTFTSGDPKP